MDERDFDDVTGRLRALGQEPVDPVTASEHLTAMAALGARPEKRFGRLAVAGAAVAGFLFGGLGLGWADALPGPAQGVANEVLQVVGPDGPWRNRGECVSTAAKTHGDNVEAKEAAKAECPKGGTPAGAGRPDGVGRPDRVGPHSDDPCKGPPPWAGRAGGPTADEQAQRDGCPADTADVEAEEAPEAQIEAEERSETTETTETTAPPVTTPTTAAPEADADESPPEQPPVDAPPEDAPPGDSIPEDAGS